MKNPESKYILVVDDEKAILRMLTKVLSRKGHRIDTASNGGEGIEKAKLNNYDIVLTDVKMPGISGIDLAKSIKAIKCENLPVIGMSGTPWLLDCRLFDAVVGKPCCREELIEIIKNVVKNR